MTKLKNREFEGVTRDFFERQRWGTIQIYIRGNPKYPYTMKGYL